MTSHAMKMLFWGEDSARGPAAMARTIRSYLANELANMDPVMDKDGNPYAIIIEAHVCPEDEARYTVRAEYHDEASPEGVETILDIIPVAMDRTQAEAEALLRQLSNVPLAPGWHWRRA